MTAHKNIKFINTYNVMINGEEYVLRKSFATELEMLINHVHFEMTAYNLHIKGNICFRCGNIFEKEITSHHALPKSLNPKYNVFVPLCEKCHVELNDLYKNGGD